MRAHHERWDGRGYPDGLSGLDIPLEARFVAITDVFDALTHRRRYRSASTHQEAKELIAAGRGTHFDPDLTDLFLFDPVFHAAQHARRAAPKAAGSARKNEILYVQVRPQQVPELSFRWRTDPAS